MHNLFLRAIALLVGLMLTTGAHTVHAQSSEPDGTLLSPNMPLPSAFGLQPTFFKGNQATAPKSTKITRTVAQPLSQSGLNTFKEDGGLGVRRVSATQHRAKVAKTSETKSNSSAKATVVAKKTTTAKTATASTVVRNTSRRGLATMTVRSTAYNSLPSQTDHTPFITATGARTRFGVVALSRDLLRRIPYGSLLRIEDMGGSNGRGRGAFNRMLSGVSFVVEDTMHPRKVNTVDVWMSSKRTAMQWGKRQIRVTVLRYGRR